ARSYEAHRGGALWMNVFEYGQPHPRGLAGTKQTSEAAARLAVYFFGLLGEAGRLYEQGGDGVAAGLALFDREAHNIRAGWKWARERRSDDRRAAELCRD